jgi:rhamnose utilization protein RhaD (predicted bifunctional aldolase and dehydrogenase)
LILWARNEKVGKEPCLLMANTRLDELVQLSNRLGDPANEYAILGEGNTSVLEDDGSFWVKASGSQLRTITREGFVGVSLQRALDMLDEPGMDDEAVARALTAARTSSAPGPMPSVETVVHAVCLEMPGVRFVGHTHPTPVNSILCSSRFRELLAGRLFPDEVVVCGPEPVLVEYVDPGLRLAERVRVALGAYLGTRGFAPKTVYLQNHGLIALGRTAREVENITAMAVKAARILLGTLTVGAGGGPNFLPASQVERIQNRADEHYRQRIIGNGA